MWDGDQVLYELRTDGNSNLSTLNLDRNYITGLAFGKAGYVHAGGIDRPLFMTDGRVPNYNWRGLVESSSWADGAPADCSIATGSCTTIAWPGQVGVYMKPGLGGSTPNAAQWVGNVIQNGAGSTGLLFRRNRSFDPSTGQFTQQDPIGIAGGANVYGFANGDPINFSDPFGLCPPEKTKRPCPAGEITLQPGNGGLSSGILTTGAMAIAEQTGKHLSIHGGSRTFNPDGSNDASQHRTDLGGGGAIDFHLFNRDSSIHGVLLSSLADRRSHTSGMSTGRQFLRRKGF